MSKTVTIKPDEQFARLYADRLILEALVDLHEVIKPGELSEQLSSKGLGLAAIRSLLASNADLFAYNERRWVPKARLDTEGRPMMAAVDRLLRAFGAPVAVDLVAREIAIRYGIEPEDAADCIRRFGQTDPLVLLTRDDRVVSTEVLFRGSDESRPRAYKLAGITEEEVADAQKKLGDFDWLHNDALVLALEKAAPVSLKALGAAAWVALSPDSPFGNHLFDWRTFYADLLSIPGYVISANGVIAPEAEGAKWVAQAAKLADKLAPTVEIEDAVPIELKPEDIENMVKKVTGASETVTAKQLLEELFEITPTVRTYPDDMANVMDALRGDKRVMWVGGDRFQKPEARPDDVDEIPMPFQYVASDHLQEDGDPVDVELVDEGLSSSLRKLILHPLAQDVLDEELQPRLKNIPDQIRLVLKPIHRELGTFPMAQFPTGWFDDEPGLQEVILNDTHGRTLQVWLNTKLRLMFGLFEWWIDQPIESGAVFQLTRTNKPNVFDFEWLDQTDPVVYVSNQRMEELREIATRADSMSTFEILREVMSHWSKGADFLTIMWEVNVVRRTSRRLLASLLSSYVCFYQRSGSPVWHYDHKKVEQGFDKTKKKFIKKN